MTSVVQAIGTVMENIDPACAVITARITDSANNGSDSGADADSAADLRTTRGAHQEDRGDLQRAHPREGHPTDLSVGATRERREPGEHHA